MTGSFMVCNMILKRGVKSWWATTPAMIEVEAEEVTTPVVPEDREVVGRIRLKFFKKVSNKERNEDQGVCVKGDEETAWESSWMDSMYVAVFDRVFSNSSKGGRCFLSFKSCQNHRDHRHVHEHHQPVSSSWVVRQQSQVLMDDVKEIKKKGGKRERERNRNKTWVGESQEVERKRESIKKKKTSRILSPSSTTTWIKGLYTWNEWGKREKFMRGLFAFKWKGRDSERNLSVCLSLSSFLTEKRISSGLEVLDGTPNTLPSFPSIQEWLMSEGEVHK